MLRLDTTSHSGRLMAAVAVAMLSPVGAPAYAQDGAMHPVDSALEMMNLKTKAGPMPDFVTQSRDTQAEDGYVPIGAKPPTRDLKAKSASEVNALTAELDAARDAQLAGKRPKPMGAKPVPAKVAKPGSKPLALQGGPTSTINR